MTTGIRSTHMKKDHFYLALHYTHFSLPRRTGKGFSAEAVSMEPAEVLPASKPAALPSFSH